jgi:hypothetical protein
MTGRIKIFTFDGERATLVHNAFMNRPLVDESVNFAELISWDTATGRLAVADLTGGSFRYYVMPGLCYVIDLCRMLCRRDCDVQGGERVDVEPCGRD